ncbi:dual specificity protein phosphatase 19-like [Homalodisca vitripennis]|uniref:dual specificity protein phosphatase 19-like n=1 Tax=Homalodisca vitripennis TaxID=197043 RepID=UPI001EEA211E|nr:dual specificity protein phosphatase 19-like [Homalodisca vitripennis]
MSFLEALQKKKSDLKQTDTLVKTSAGDVFLESHNAAGSITLHKIDSDVGYIVDLKPDLQVAGVVPGLFMGSQDVTQDSDLLQEHGITHILSVGVEVHKFPSVKYTILKALDLPEFDMRPVFETAIKLIADEIESGGRILVHCNAGVSRSASIVIAFLMKREKLCYKDAYFALKNVRPCIKPNEGFVKQLKCLEQELFLNKID